MSKGRKLTIFVSASIERHDKDRGMYMAVLVDYQGFGSTADEAVEAVIAQARQYGAVGEKDDFIVVKT